MPSCFFLKATPSNHLRGITLSRGNRCRAIHTIRPASLGLKSPLDYLISQGAALKMIATRTKIDKDISIYYDYS
jgi:hypothetical protein